MTISNAQISEERNALVFNALICVKLKYNNKIRKVHLKRINTSRM